MNHWLRISIAAPRCAALLLLAAAPAAAQPYFDAPWRAFDAIPVEITAEGLYCIRAGDLDGDGLPDIVVGQVGATPPGLPAGRDGLRVLFNEGNAGGPPAIFSEADFYPTTYDVLDLTLADLDGDGDLDIAAAAMSGGFYDYGDGNLIVLRNAGDGTFGAPVYYDVGPYGPGASRRPTSTATATSTSS